MSNVTICDQPECLLQKADVDRRSLAESIVRLLAGEDLSQVTHGEEPIQAHDRCVECAVRILGGVRPYPTVEDVERKLEAGHWSHRRWRRRSRHDERDTGS